jgi:uncharacterized protein
MKSLKIVLAAGAFALLSTPAFAQIAGADGQQFIDAVQKRDGDKATQLIATHPTVIDTKNEDGDTGLIVSIRASDHDWTGFLLNKGADPNLQGKNGDTPLITAARVGFDEAAGWLIGLGAKVDGTNKGGETPLIIAVQQRDVPMVKLLLQHGADPDRTDHVAGYSARDYANRDARARDIQKLINEMKPKGGGSSASN